MADQTAEGDARYWAFISYSHKDAAFGRRLHRRLESYVVPRRLVGRELASGSVPKKLVPIFRDREEFPAANDLSVEVRAALKASRSLIVVCSPSAAASRWVSREVETFRELHPDGPILAAIRDGEPQDSFPEILHTFRADGTVIEPLAADFRRGRDGEQLGLLKLVAGIIGVGLDELIQRDAHRRNQRVTAVTAGALAGMLVMGVLTAYALNARSEAERQRVEAERQRSEAEGLVEYMLTELRIKLKGVGRIDVMADVNSRALKYYDGEFDNLDLASRAQRARVLQQLGENDEDRGDYKSALKKFTEARQTTAALLRAAPRDPERIFDHAQSEYWMGSIEYFGNNRLDAAMRWFREYKRLVDMTVAIEPGNPKYLREAGYADGNLCAIDEKQALTPKATVELCKTALAKMEKAAKYLKPDSGITDDIVNRLGWLADAYVDSGDLAQARAVRLRQESILDPQIAADPWNMAHKSDWIALQIALATLDEKADRMKDAKGRLERARAILEFMIEFDPQNQPWKSQMDWIRNELKKFN